MSWLASKNGASVIGDAYDGWTCPLATYLTEYVGIDCFVSELEIYHGAGDPSETVETPSWITGFILALHAAQDQQCGTPQRCDRRDAMPVTAARAMAVAVQHLS
jgi:hypothetical protein